MARPAATRDIKKLIQYHQDNLALLKEGVSEEEKYRQEVSHQAMHLIQKEVFGILQTIPVEEVNRDKHGFRVKALKAAGYNTIADVAAASVGNLASVYGVSENQAYAIKGVVNEITNKASQDVKIRLNQDKKTDESTALVEAVSKYRKSKEVAGKCAIIIDNDESRIQKALNEIQPARNGLRWLFTSRKQKDQAQTAYEILEELRESAYDKQCKTAQKEINNLHNISADQAWNDFSHNSIRFTNVLEDVCPGSVGNGDTVYGLSEDLAREIQGQDFFPDGLLCELRRYQEWGVKYILHQGRVLLGDEMGLGKTIQAIATMVSLRNTGATHFLVVCPASVLENWCREIRKQSRLSVTKIHGSDRQSEIHSWLKSGGVGVTTYETTGCFNLDPGFMFSLLVVDEAHYIKNAEAKRTMNVVNISKHSERLLLMTGTALENKVDEMISLIDILRPDIAAKAENIKELGRAPQFRNVVAPVYYRRKREDVLTELPDLVENEEWCTLGGMEEARYESAVLARKYNDARRVSWNVDDLHQSSKAKRTLELIEEAESDGRKVIVFSFFLDTLYKVSEFLGSRCMPIINGSVSPSKRQEIIDQFDQAPAGTVLVSQIQAGGTGLNIQSASVVIICEPQLKPSIENQAISRAYRMGQTRNVLVYRLLCQDTVDERITNMLHEKQTIFDAFADKSVAAEKNREIDSKTLGSIIQDEIDRINAKHQAEQNTGV